MSLLGVSNYGGMKNWLSLRTSGKPIVPVNAQLTPVRKIAATQIVRPSNTTQYAIGDAVGATAGSLITLTGVVDNNGDWTELDTVKLLMSTAAATAAQLGILFFDTAPTPTADNAALDTADAEMAKAVGIVSLTTEALASSAARFYCKSGIGLRMKCAAASKNLYALLVALNTYTPASAETFDFSFLFRPAEAY